MSSESSKDDEGSWWIGGFGQLRRRRNDGRLQVLCSPDLAYFNRRTISFTAMRLFRSALFVQTLDSCIASRFSTFLSSLLFDPNKFHQLAGQRVCGVAQERHCFAPVNR